MTVLTQLEALEAEAVYVMREVAAEFERPVLLFSGGKDSIVLLRLAEKAFRPARFPCPILHIDTGHNFAEVLEFRDRRVAELGEQLIVASVQDSIDSGRAHEDGPSRNRLQTVTLLDALREGRFDAAFGGARRDEERARAKERVLSFRDELGQWEPRNQRPEVWDLFNTVVRRGESVRAFPISNWTELDVWRYIEAEELEVPSIYFAHEREVFERDGMLFAVSEHSPPPTARRRVRRARALPHRGRPHGDRRGALGRAPTSTRSSRRPRRRGRPSAAPPGRTTARPPPPWKTASARAISSAGSAAHRHGGLRRRRQVDPDRAPAARLQAAARRPGRGRPRARHRRPAGRARAGHHDRRRLPLLRHAAALVHPRRHARPRPLHAQHGHRRLDRRPRAGADRRAQGAARAVAPARLPGGAARHPAPRGVREQDGPRRLRRGALPRDRGGVRRAGRAARDRRRARGADLGAGGRQRRRRLAAAGLVRRRRRCSSSSRRSRSTATATSTTSASPSSGRSATATTAATRGGSPAACWRPATRSSCCPSGSRSRIARIDTPRRAGRARVPADGGDAAARGRARRRPRRPRRRAPANAPEVARELDATVCWMVEAPARVGARYLLKHTTRRVRANIAEIAARGGHRLFEVGEASELGLNDIGRLKLRTAAPVLADPYAVQPRDGRVHPDRRAHARHRRGGDGRVRAAGPRRRARAQPGHPLAPERAGALDALVARPASAARRSG